MEIPAGWYPDPHSQDAQRYWDGNQWTGNSIPAAGQSPAGGPLPLGAEPPHSAYDPPPFGAMPSYGAPAQPLGSPPPGYAAPTPGHGAAASSDSRQWSMFAHLSALLASIIGFAFLGPLVIFLVKGNEDPFVRDHAAEALNFNLSMLIYAIVGGIVTVVLIILVVGLLLIPVWLAAAVAWLVLTIIAAVKASRGEVYRYPLTIRFVR